jgi:hypothetical protein
MRFEAGHDDLSAFGKTIEPGGLIESEEPRPLKVFFTENWKKHKEQYARCLSSSNILF